MWAPHRTVPALSATNLIPADGNMPTRHEMGLLVFFLTTIAVVLAVPRTSSAIESARPPAIARGGATDGFGTTARVARGNPVTTKELARSMAYVFNIDRSNGRASNFLCTATVVAYQWLLLAAHCVIKVNGEVRIGRYGSYAGTKRHVAEIYRHNSFKGSNMGYSYDIGLVKLNEPVLDAFPIKLNRVHWYPHSEATVFAFGYGIDENSKGALVLRTGQFVALSHENCFYELNASNERGIARSIKSKYHLCANERKYGRGMCLGDSGGPLVTRKEDGSLLQVGINSFRVAGACGDVRYPDMYTRVSSFNWWIDKHLDNQPGYRR